jgi:RecA-family ATPase
MTLRRKTCDRVRSSLAQIESTAASIVLGIRKPVVGSDTTEKFPDKDAQPIELSFIDIAKWQDTPAPEREWTIKGRIPQSSVTLCSGEGGVGKTILMLHCGAAIALGRDWLGALPEPGPVLGLFCEDDEDELHRRLDRIVEHYGETHTELAKNFKATSRVGEDAVMAAPNRNGIIEPIALFRQMHEVACDLFTTVQ